MCYQSDPGEKPSVNASVKNCQMSKIIITTELEKKKARDRQVLGFWPRSIKTVRHEGVGVNNSMVLLGQSLRTCKVD